MAQATIVDAKYIFLDIVGFTRGRHVEAQAAIVEKLNEIVSTVLNQDFKIAVEDRILIPTGDGMCIVLLDRDAPYDVHVEVALRLLAHLHPYNDETEDEMMRFEVRIGINANEDNMVTDINGNRNMAGAGINVAQRVMNFADGNQILVSTRVHETLRDRRKYMGMFRSYSGTAKHGRSIPVYQLVKKELGLDIAVPSAFQKPKQVKREEPRLSKHVAYYLAHAIRNLPILVENRDSMYDDDAFIILLHSLAQDSEKQAESSEIQFRYFRTFKAESATFLEQYEHYRGVDNYVASDLSHFIGYGNEAHLSTFSNCFIRDSIGIPDFRAASDHGKQKLKQDWPEIWEEFELSIRW